MQPETVVTAEKLVKAYGNKRVVDGLSLRCRKGSVLGLLGPNGAGKTTTLKMLYGLIEPNDGTIRYGDLDFRTHRTEIKRRIGVSTQHDTLDQDLTVAQNLHVYANYFRPRIPDVAARSRELLELFGLSDYADSSTRVLSGGFLRRLLIARSLVHRPTILYLDEPTTGLDPKARVDLWELVHRLRLEGLAIVLTTHYMDEAERLSDELLVMNQGRTVAEGAPQQVLGTLLGEHILVIPSAEPRQGEMAAWISTSLGLQASKVLGELHVPLSPGQFAQFSEKFSSTRFTIRPPNLDDLFLRMSIDADKRGDMNISRTNDRDLPAQHQTGPF